MYRAVLMSVLIGWLLPVAVRCQPAVRPEATVYVYHSPTTDKESWQRLNLWLSSTFLYVIKEALADQDSCLLQAAHSMGMSRFPILAEGFGDATLLTQSKWIDQHDPTTGIHLLSKATGKNHLQLLLLLGAYYAFQPAGYARYKDSVDYFLNKAVAESKALEQPGWGRIARCLQGKIYLQAYDPRGDAMYQSLIDDCKRAGDQQNEARAIGYRGIYTAPRQATFQRKIDDLLQASELYRRLGDREGEVNMLTDLGYLFNATGQHAAAYDVFLKALSLAESIRFPYTQYNTEAMTMVTFFQGKFGEPLRYTRQTIKVAERCRDSIGWAYFYSRMAFLYEFEGRLQESNNMAHKALQRFIIDRNPAGYNLLHLITTYMSDQGHAKEALELVHEMSKKVDSPVNISDQIFYHYVLADCYINVNQLAIADAHIKKMDSLETLAEAVRGPLRRTEVDEMKGLVCLKRKQYRQAKAYFEKHFTAAAYGTHNLSNNLFVYRMLIIADSALGNAAAVIAHYKAYVKLLDSNFTVTKIRQAEELQIIYETQEKESQIAVLNQQAKQTTLVKNVTLAGIAAVVIIAVLLYRQNRLRRKSNTIITHTNGQLQDLLADKEWLLKEIHHRVKNNLQIIMSLLDSQSKYIDNNAALTAINDSQRRVQAISLIHQKLYQGENTASINMRQYIDELVSYLQDSFDTGSRAVIEQAIEPITLDVAKAIPVGLIINEGIVNAIKYAFPGQQKGIVRVGLQYSGPDHLLLTIADNGIGTPPDSDLSKSDSLGFNLMRGLTRQLEGVMRIENNNGLQVSIRFSVLNDHLYE